MPNIKKVYKKVFWIVFVIIFIIVTIVIGKIIFDSVYHAISSGYKPTIILPKLSRIINEVSNTERYGHITSDEIWSGTINVIGDVIVTNGVILTIKPGTTVLISANSDKKNLMTIPEWQLSGIAKERTDYIHEGEPFRDESNHITIWITGTLNAVGTSKEKIIIKSDSQNPGKYDWNTFNIENGELSYVEVRDYRALGLYNGTKLTNSELYNVGECPICIHNQQGKVLIENNWIHDSGHEIVDILNSNPIIINNRFGPSPQFVNPGGYPAGWGGLIVGSGLPTIKGNIIEGFDDAVSFFDKQSYDELGEQVLRDNTFRNNIENVVFNPNPD